MVIFDRPPLQNLLIKERPLTFKKSRRTFLNVKKLSFFSKKLYINSSFATRRLRLVFGEAAFVNLKPLILSNGFTLKLVLILKRLVRKRGKSFRSFFLKPANFIKISKQSKGARMGKGKGKSLASVQRMLPMKPLVEFSGVR
jgi:hypothetical protein